MRKTGASGREFDEALGRPRLWIEPSDRSVDASKASCQDAVGAEEMENVRKRCRWPFKK